MKLKTMTTTSRPVSRITTRAYNTLYASGRKARPIVIKVGTKGSDSDIVTFREKGRRVRFSVSIDELFRYTVKREAFLKRMQKSRNKKN